MSIKSNLNIFFYFHLSPLFTPLDSSHHHCFYHPHRANLYELIKKNNFQGFSLGLIRRFAQSLLKCLQMLHREKIIHCDLKPVNVLLLSSLCSSVILTLLRLHLHVKNNYSIINR